MGCKTVKNVVLGAAMVVCVAPFLAGVVGTFIDDVFCMQDFGEDDAYAASNSASFSSLGSDSGSHSSCFFPVTGSLLMAEYLLGGYIIYNCLTSKSSQTSRQATVSSVGFDESDSLLQEEGEFDVEALDTPEQRESDETFKVLQLDDNQVARHKGLVAEINKFSQAIQNHTFFKSKEKSSKPQPVMEALQRLPSFT